MKKVWNLVRDILSGKEEHILITNPSRIYSVWASRYNKMLKARDEYFASCEESRKLYKEMNLLKEVYGSWDSGILCEGRIRLWKLETLFKLSEFKVTSKNMVYEAALTDLKYWKIFL